VRDSLRSIWLMIALALASFWLAAPAAAWSVHGTAHVGATVGIDEHHEHEADGSVHVVPDLPADHHDDDPDTNNGHDHMPSASTCVTAMIADVPCVAPPPAAMAVAGTRVLATLHDLRHPPPARPPSIG
jgi:hypothetical protein